VLSDYAPVLDDEFKLVIAGYYDCDGVIFDFSQAALSEGLAWNTADFAQSGVISIIAIPEASAFAMLAGLAALSFALRRRKLK
jgi:hypothetical protein